MYYYTCNVNVTRLISHLNMYYQFISNLQQYLVYVKLTAYIFGLERIKDNLRVMSPKKSIIYKCNLSNFKLTQNLTQVEKRYNN